MKKAVSLGLSDGLLQTILFVALGDYCFSTYYHNLRDIISFGCVPAIICSVIIFMALNRKINNKTGAFLCTSILSFIATAPIVVSISSALGIHFFPQRPIGDADGLIWLLAQCCFVGASIVLRFIIALSRSPKIR